MNSYSHCMVLTTTNSQESANRLIDALFDAGLAACIQTMEISSHYLWEGKRRQDKEVLLIIKTLSRHYTEVETVITASHPYEIPQIVQVPFSAGFNPYLSWIEESVRSDEA